MTTARWVQRGLVWRLERVEAPPTPPTSEPVEVGLLRACPTCRALVNQSCRTVSGHTTTPHGSRLVPRLCLCGAPLAPRRRYCDPCRDRIDAANRYAGVVRWRARNLEAS